MFRKEASGGVAAGLTAASDSREPEAHDWSDAAIFPKFVPQFRVDGPQPDDVAAIAREQSSLGPFARHRRAKKPPRRPRA